MWNRRCVLLWSVLLVALAGAGLVGVAWLTTPTPAITPENADRVQYAMTLGQVERLFGSRGEEPQSRFLEGSKPNTKEWVNPETGFIVGVTFDVDGRAVEGATEGRHGGFTFIPPGSLFDRLRWRLWRLGP